MYRIIYNKIFTILLMSVVLLSAGCSSDEAIEQAGKKEMNFLVQHPGDKLKATSSNFETGDKIGVFVVEEEDGLAAPLQVSGNHTNNAALTFGGSTWQPSKPIYWPETEVNVDVYGYYPYMDIISVDAQPFSVQLDQSLPAAGGALSGYEASDFLWSKATSVGSSAGVVPLKFHHRMTKVVINLVKGADYEGELPDNAEFYIHNTVPTAHIDFATGAVLKDPYGLPQTIKCRKLSKGTFEAILVPQHIESRRPIFEIVAGDVAYLLEDYFIFKSGIQHNFNITINASPEQIKIEIDPSTGDWD